MAGPRRLALISPLLANVYLHRLDRAWEARGHGALVRHADDLVVMCHTEGAARAALAAVRAILADVGLELKAAKTRIVHLREGGEGFDFLGFHHRWVRARHPRWRHLTFLARWPSRATMQHARQRLRHLTQRERLPLPVERVVQDVNRFLRGWAGYLRYGNSAREFDATAAHAIRRLSIYIGKRHGRKRVYGRHVLLHDRLNRCGLIRLRGTVRPPRPGRTPRSAQCHR